MQTRVIKSENHRRAASQISGALLRAHISRVRRGIKEIVVQICLPSLLNSLLPQKPPPKTQKKKRPEKPRKKHHQQKKHTTKNHPHPPPPRDGREMPQRVEKSETSEKLEESATKKQTESGKCFERIG